MSYAFRFTSSALPDDVLVCGFEGHEVLSRPYRFKIYFALGHDADLDLADALGAKALLEMVRTPGEPPFSWHGILASVTLVDRDEHGALYRAVLVPRLEQLSQSVHSRLFCHQTLVDTIQEVLEDGGLAADDYELRIQRDYPVEEHICQYAESDLDFLHRWMELEGLYYFFEHRQDAEILVITDHKSFHGPLRAETLVYRGDSSYGPERSIRRFTCEMRALPAHVRLADYDYGNPDLDLSASSEVSPYGSGEICAHAQRFFGADQASHYATIRAEELQAHATIYELEGRSPYVRPGFVVQVDHHPKDSFNAEYLITEARHRGSVNGWSLDGAADPEPYALQAKCVSAALQYRARRVTPWPHVYGVERAIVDGEANSEYAQIDDQGRYLLKLGFDESTLKDGRASTRVRMAQPHGGSVEGWHFPLRKSTEVMVCFQGGDPDRPAILGVAPNAQTPSPVAAKNHTTNVIQTGGRNRMEMEDRDGGQRMTTYSPTHETFLRMGAPNDDVHCKLHTTGNGYIEIGRDLYVTTGGPKTEWIGGTTTEKFLGTFHTTVELGTIESYHRDKKETVDKALTEDYETSQSVHVEGDLLEKYGSHTTTVNGTRLEEVKKDLTEAYHGTLGTTVTNLVTETYDAGYLLDVKPTHNHTISGRYTRSCADHEHTNAKSTWVTMGAHIKIVGGVVSETTIGTKTEVTIAPRIESLLGIKVEASSSCRIEICGTKSGLEPAELRVVGGRLKIVANDLTSASGATLRMATAVRAKLATLLSRN